MDTAYDHIREEELSPEASPVPASQSAQTQPEQTLNSDFQEAYKAISASPWGARLGGFFGSVVKQVNTYHYSFPRGNDSLCGCGVWRGILWF